MTERVDALRLAELLALETKNMARITGKTPRFVRMSPDAPSLQPHLRRVLHIVDTLERNLAGDLGQVGIWLNAPHPVLEGKSPLELRESGSSANSAFARSACRWRLSAYLVANVKA